MTIRETYSVEGPGEPHLVPCEEPREGKGGVLRQCHARGNERRRGVHDGVSHRMEPRVLCGIHMVCGGTCGSIGGHHWVLPQSHEGRNVVKGKEELVGPDEERAVPHGADGEPEDGNAEP